MRLRYKLLVFLFVVSSLITSAGVYRVAHADEADDLRRKIEEYQNQIKSLQSKASTLSNQISQFNVKIQLTELKIQQTEDQIALLAGRIGTLNDSVSSLTSAFDARVIETYKLSRIGGDAVLVASSKNLRDALTRYQYLVRLQAADQTLLSRLKKANDGYVSQKAQLATLSTQLDKSQKDLNNQKQSKATLLSLTNNDEKKYQQLLSEARAQLAAFRKFTSGSAVLSNQTKCDSWGCYYNQRDSQWAYQLIGLSPENMKDVGCLITSMAMVATHYGKNLKPSEIASSSEPFAGNTAYMSVAPWTVNGVHMTRTRVGSSTSTLDAELSSGKPVIVGIYKGPDHFLVIKRKEGSDYIMNDPFVENGNDIKFTDKYPLSAISTVDRVSVN